MEPIYVVSLFLWPMYSKFCISKQYTLEWIIRKILTLAISWGFNKCDCIAMKQGLVEYNSHIHELLKEKDPVTFCLIVRYCDSLYILVLPVGSELVE